MVALLKLLATVKDRFPLDSSDNGFPLFSNEEFWLLYSSAMRELLSASVEPAFEFMLNQSLSEYLLE